MIMHPYFDTATKSSMAGGTLTIILANISSDDAVKTAVLAAIGAAVSFTVSQLLKYLIRKRKK